MYKKRGGNGVPSTPTIPKVRYSVLVSYNGMSMLHHAMGTTRERAFHSAQSTKVNMMVMDQHLGYGDGRITVMTTDHTPVWSWSMAEGETVNGLLLTTSIELLDILEGSCQGLEFTRNERRSIKWLRTLVTARITGRRVVRHG